VKDIALAVLLTGWILLIPWMMAALTLSLVHRARMNRLGLAKRWTEVDAALARALNPRPELSELVNAALARSPLDVKPLPLPELRMRPVAPPPPLPPPHPEYRVITEVIREPAPPQREIFEMITSDGRRVHLENGA
jgi:hypothetical protein